jgi:hypothetical protein
MKFVWSLLVLLSLSTCHHRPEPSGRTAHPVPAPAAARQQPETSVADSTESEPLAPTLYRQALEQAQREITPDNAWRQLRAIERAVDSEREATSP